MQDEELQIIFTSHKVEPEIGIAEYQLAGKSIEEHQRSFNWAASITSILSPLIATISAGATEIPRPAWLQEDSIYSIQLGLLFLVFFYSLIASAQFANITKNRVFAERKIITIRRMLGADYGDQSLVLPNWRLEGARHPFAIKMWKGYLGFYNLPVNLLYCFSFVSFLYLTPSALDLIRGLGFGARFSDAGFSFGLSSILTVIVAVVYRRQLYDNNENIILSVAKIASKLFAVRLVENIQYAIYRMKLNIEEARRLGYSFSEVEKMCVFIEDRRFERHYGISPRAMASAFWRRLARGKVSGGSTITQQLARTVFISDFAHPVRRKIVELFLALWIESSFSKKQILEAYVTSVRFEDGIYGFHRASRHFQLSGSKKPTKAEAFFLVERIANVRKKFKSARVEHLLRQALEAQLLDKQDISEVLSLYSRLAKNHLRGGFETKSPNELAVGFLE